MMRGRQYGFNAYGMGIQNTQYNASD